MSSTYINNSYSRMMQELRYQKEEALSDKNHGYYATLSVSILSFFRHIPDIYSKNIFFTLSQSATE